MIRIARKDELQQCIDLIQLVIGTVNSQNHCSELIEEWKLSIDHFHYSSRVFVYSEDDKILGVGEVWNDQIKRVYVHPAHLRKGIGNALMDRLEQRVLKLGYRRCFLKSSPYAVEFYKSLGYEFVKEIISKKRGLELTLTQMCKELC